MSYNANVSDSKIKATLGGPVASETSITLDVGGVTLAQGDSEIRMQDGDIHIDAQGTVFAPHFSAAH